MLCTKANTLRKQRHASYVGASEGKSAKAMLPYSQLGTRELSCYRGPAMRMATRHRRSAC